MDVENSKPISKIKSILSIRHLYHLLAPRAYSVIMFGAIFCTLAVKFFHSVRIDLISQYPRWILTDVAILLTIEIILATICFRWPIKSVIRIVTIVAAIMCTWSIMNAAWLIRTGTQILPTVLLPLIRNPLNSLSIVGVNLAKMPLAAVILLGPSAIALAFFFCALAKPLPPKYRRKYFANKILISLLIIFIAVLPQAAVNRRGSVQTISERLRYNSQLRAIKCLVLHDSGQLAKTEIANVSRRIPNFEQLEIVLSNKSPRINHNVVVVVLEGVQYNYTSLADQNNNLTPYLATLAQQGVEFTNMRASLTHTTKALFSLLTGRFPSTTHDIAETVPVTKPYATIATILKQKLNFKTAFFQSAKGNFEARPALVHNLGFDKFWARDDLNDPNAYLGYLACDEFSMLNPITEWIKADDKSFFLMILCSVTHDPYVVPDWFATPAKDPVERYRQSIFYTDKFIAALDAELATLNLTDKTILCVIGDHGEAFGEHGLLGHERIAFEEALHIPFYLRAPFLVKPNRKVTKPVSSIDFAPTMLTLLGFDIDTAGFDGIDVLGPLPDDRKVYFSGWLQQSQAGFLIGNRKLIYHPANKTVYAYDLYSDPSESNRIELPTQQQSKIADEIVNWRKNTIFQIDQKQTGKKMLFDRWLCRWNGRIASAKYQPKTKN